METRKNRRWISVRSHTIGLFVAPLLLLGTMILLSSCTAPTMAQQPGTTQPAVAVTIAPPPPVTSTVRAAQRQLSIFAKTDVGLMQPAIDAQGNLWVGEMYANRLGRIDTNTGAVTQWHAPKANYGIMTTTVDAQGNVWFVEQDSDYIGRFDPRTQAFRVFPLGKLNGRALGPQDLQFDAHGLLWFTAAAGGGIGRLDPSTGALHVWSVPSLTNNLVSPYSLALAADGRVWFGELSGGAIGQLDPATGHITLYRLGSADAQVFAMAIDGKGRVWFTEMVPSKLGMFDPASNTLTELPIPALPGSSSALYGLVIARDGSIWFVDNGADALVRYMLDAHNLTFYKLNLPAGAPYGLTLDQSGRLWFTADGSSINYVGMMNP